jgi:rare lipoprotein A (peptidoglycan hydrolase)
MRKSLFATALLCLIGCSPANAEEVLGIDRAAAGMPAAKLGKARHFDASGNSIEARVARSALVATINAKLARWVKPTGNCQFGSTETLATYYNSGHRTATGARFNPMGMTAAHRTLPFGTRLHITNPHNGRSVGITINDRGPYTNAKIDLAEGAARAIGMRTSIYVCISGLGMAAAE